MSDLSMGADFGKVLFGQHAVHVPMWMWVQDAGTDNGDAFVTFVGASKVRGLAHPLRFGSQRTHQLVVGELLIRPHKAVATDEYRGHGISGLALLGSTVLPDLMTDGDVLLDLR